MAKLAFISLILIALSSCRTARDAPSADEKALSQAVETQFEEFQAVWRQLYFGDGCGGLILDGLVDTPVVQGKITHVEGDAVTVELDEETAGFAELPATMECWFGSRYHGQIMIHEVKGDQAYGVLHKEVDSDSICVGDNVDSRLDLTP